MPFQPIALASASSDVMVGRNDPGIPRRLQRLLGGFADLSLELADPLPASKKPQPKGWGLGLNALRESLDQAS